MLFKTGRSGKLYSKKVYRSDWVSKAGYEPIVRSTSEQEQENVKGIQKFQFLLNMFPNNPALRKIAQKRSLEIVDLSPDELKEVEEAEERLQAQMMMQPQALQAGSPSVPSGQLEPIPALGR